MFCLEKEATHLRELDEAYQRHSHYAETEEEI